MCYFLTKDTNYLLQPEKDGKNRTLFNNIDKSFDAVYCFIVCFVSVTVLQFFACSKPILVFI